MVFESFEDLLAYTSDDAGAPLVYPVTTYFMDYDDQAQRRVLGEQCRNAFKGGQCVITFPA